MNKIIRKIQDKLSDKEDILTKLRNLPSSKHIQGDLDLRSLHKMPECI